MELKVLRKEKSEIELELSERDDTLLYPLVQQLQSDETVEIARYITGHPLLEKTRLYVRVKEGKPETALKRAAKTLAKKFEDCLELVSKVKIPK